MYQILLYYKYTPIHNPQELMHKQRALCERLALKGRILIATEGINGTVEGTVTNTQTYIQEMSKNPSFADINWKKSPGTGNAFPKLKVKVRPEIVTTGIKDKDFGPLKAVTGKYLSCDELYRWYCEGREFYILDMRNDFEYEVGRFKHSIFPQGLYHFRDLIKTIGNISHLKDKTVVTVCTGGVRCETASGLLIKYGFKDVYQLQNGIVTFMEKYPNTFFEGKLYVFDGRMTIGFHTHSQEHKIIGRCRFCQKPSENLVNWHDENGRRVHGILCEDCCAKHTDKLQGQYKQQYLSVG